DSIRVEGQDSNNSRLMIRQDQVQPSVEALEEVSVQTSNFAAEYGQVSGGLFNFVAKSGTNQFHGSAFEYFVNEDLGAGIPYTNGGNGHLVRPKNRRHDYGGSVGGPVWIPKLYNGRNRTFFFFAYEKFHQNQDQAGLLNNWDQSYPSYTDEVIPSIKIDEYFPKGKMSFYYSKYFGPHFNTPDGLPSPLTQNRYLPTLTHTTRVNFDLPVTPTLMIHGGFGFMRHVNCDITVAENLSYDALAQIGLKGGLPSAGQPNGCVTSGIKPSATTGLARITGLFSGTGGGMWTTIGTCCNNPVILNKPTAVLSGMLVRGSHTYKVGGEWRIDAFTNGNGAAAAGIYNFSNAQ